MVDGTFGGGGHTQALAQAVQPGGLVYAVDLDPGALRRGRAVIADLPVKLLHGSFAELPELLPESAHGRLDGVLLDLGLSSDQLADAERGFSFQSAGDLDLRFDPDRGEPAWRMLEWINEKRLADLIFKYGEERQSRRIARRIVEQRRQQPIRTAAELADLVRSCVRRGRGHRIDPATRTFQALRIAVNGELEALETALRCIPDLLGEGGRLAIISFHSLEDRLVKWAFRDDQRLQVLTRRPLQADDAEVAANPRASSAKLRIAERTQLKEA